MVQIVSHAPEQLWKCATSHWGSVEPKGGHWLHVIHTYRFMFSFHLFSSEDIITLLTTQFMYLKNVVYFLNFITTSGHFITVETQFFTIV